MGKLFNWLVLLSLIITATVSFSNNCSHNSFNNNISNIASNSNHFFISGANNSNLKKKLQISSSELNYKLGTGDTDLLTGLVSRTGVTKGDSVVETKIKENTGIHSAPVTVDITSSMVDFKNSYYVIGSYDWEKNGFIEKEGCKQKLQLGTNAIKINGIYHLYLIDNAGFCYDYYLELGITNWGWDTEFKLNDLKTLGYKLNVSVKNCCFKSVTKAKQAVIWLYKYQWDADQAFNKAVRKMGKGFNITINDLKNGYKEFLDEIKYLPALNIKEDIDYNKLSKVITTSANKYLQEYLNNSEKCVDMQGYSLQQLLNGRSLPRTKQEIDNYYNGESFSQWLQNIANIKYYYWHVTLYWIIPSFSSFIILLLLLSSGYFLLKSKKICQRKIINNIILINDLNNKYVNEQLFKIRFYLINKDWNNYFFSLQNLMKKMISYFLELKDDSLNFNENNKLLVNKLNNLLTTKQVNRYIQFIEKTNFYYNNLNIKHRFYSIESFEWNKNNELTKISIAWELYFSLKEFINLIQKL